MTALGYTVIPVIAVLFGAIVTVWRPPGPRLTSAIQHLAAGVVFAAAAAEILPQVMHERSPAATLIGGTAGMLVMLGLKSLEDRLRGPIALIGAIGTDLLIDGLVLGLAFIAGEKAGLLLTIALTLEVLFLGVTVTDELGETIRSKARIVAIAVALALLMPLGAVAALPIAAFPPHVVTGFLSFGLIALLYLVTEELLVEAHEKPDTPLISAMFFVGFLALLLIEEMIG
ncbi:transporter [Hankyongella ginsenosidimutans]|uniref:Transporter n=1 Tax=Hankyongella ginsenosidimutans TaxID=1763828 RepID=A0A4D7C887_9SPHN|nr:transporter [Hankyongella ginsenosidimutans]QCI80490.1 transporter [Hankyongella ginsenosidimutans]